MAFRAFSRRHCSPLLALLALALACSRAPKTYPIGGDLRALPGAGSAPLVALIPTRAEAVMAVRDPQASLEALRRTRLYRQLIDQGWRRDSLALPFVERWRALQAKLSELARSPLPDPEALLDASAILAWIPGSNLGPPGLLLVARLEARSARALALARALNAVRASGREVEIERVRGIAVREVWVGGNSSRGQRLAYAVLADRVLVATDEGLVAEGLNLGLGAQGHSLASRSPFADLEARAEAAGLAAAWVPSAGERFAPGVISAELDGHDLTLQLDPALWGDSSRRPAPDPSALFWLGLPGLDLPAAYARSKPQLPRGDSPANTLEVQRRLDALAEALGRGLFVQAIPRPGVEHGMVAVVDALSGPPAGASALEDRVAALASVLLGDPVAPESIPGGVLHCSAEDRVCLASCPFSVRAAWPGAYLRQHGCSALRERPPADLAVAWGLDPPLLSAELHSGRGRLELPEGP